ncbi:IclR family transcriptional regulator [Roseovarius arcticus]|uniref:IclR family transcriptional regulator n=1 Tax=Roseovarius arcticus TaxID=2547404 RepID=UPI00148626D1|nr:IclR family transcriptional regulator [Roseovarius arcticus]
MDLFTPERIRSTFGNLQLEQCHYIGRPTNSETIFLVSCSVIDSNGDWVFTMTGTPQRDVLNKSVALIDALSRASGSMRFVDLVKAAGLPKSTSHRLLGSLAREGLVEFDAKNQRYRLGLKILTWASNTWNNVEVASVAVDEIDALHAKVSEQVSLAVRDGMDVVYVRATECNQQLKIIASQIGDREPAHCTAVGKVMLAHLPTATLDELLGTRTLTRFTENTITDRAKFEQELSQIRQRGFAYSDREKHEMVRGIAAPVFDFEGRIIAALNIWAPVFRIEPEVLLAWTDVLNAAALRISQKMGHTA